MSCTAGAAMPDGCATASRRPTHPSRRKPPPGWTRGCASRASALGDPGATRTALSATLRARRVGARGERQGGGREGGIEVLDRGPARLLITDRRSRPKQLIELLQVGANLFI